MIEMQRHRWWEVEERNTYIGQKRIFGRVRNCTCVSVCEFFFSRVQRITRWINTVSGWIIQFSLHWFFLKLLRVVYMIWETSFDYTNKFNTLMRYVLDYIRATFRFWFLFTCVQPKRCALSMRLAFSCFQLERCLGYYEMYKHFYLRFLNCLIWCYGPKRITIRWISMVLLFPSDLVCVNMNGGDCLNEIWK